MKYYRVFFEFKRRYQKNLTFYCAYSWNNIQSYRIRKRVDDNHVFTFFIFDSLTSINTHRIFVSSKAESQGRLCWLKQRLQTCWYQIFPERESKFGLNRKLKMICTIFELPSSNKKWIEYLLTFLIWQTQ